jgi:[glutamine synthetase] adenylyltransferase / [glutamine synthetase]-adenylyl-L-tyrosine phosphorylase
MLFSFDPSRLPKPYDMTRAKLGMERWREAVLRLAPREERELAEAATGNPATRLALDSMFGNSAFLTHCLAAEPDMAARLLHEGPDWVTRFATDSLLAAGREWDEAQVMRALRLARNRIALASAFADIANLWPLERVTGALSDCADQVTDLALRHLLLRAAREGAFAGDSEGATSGPFVLGLGKLGAHELNFSSDIDLMVLYDLTRVATSAPDRFQAAMVRVARHLVRLLQERTESGYAFRVDLRLRPDPSATPLALSTEAAEIYYEGAGQNWERAALIKARTIAGDFPAGKEFLKSLVPFLWRKHLDFAAIQDIHSIKRQIHAFRGHERITVFGHNLKLGRGGIREIEFFAQTQQLIYGGREPSLRVSPTCAALEALADAGRIDRKVAVEMTQAYRFLRRVEHRLQMIDDRQTHSLPKTQAGLDALSTFLGYERTNDFAEELLGNLGIVESHYADLFEEAPALGAQGNLVFTGTEDDPDTLATLRRLGYADPSSVANVVRGWHHGRYRATRSARARELLTELMPELLAAFARTPDPDLAFMRFNQFLGNLPAGVQLLSLFHSNPFVLDLVAEIIGGAPRLAEHMARHPQLLDAVLMPDFGAPVVPAALQSELATQLAQSRDFQDVLDIVRRFANDQRFRIGVQMLRGATDGDRAGPLFTAIADTALVGLLPHVEAEFERVHGKVPGGAHAVVALGKYGGREMTAASDLDLIIMYDVPVEVEASVGPKRLAPLTYYTRLCARIIAAITAHTSEGVLYEVDMRLRPSGSKGPLGTSLASFDAYHGSSDAWTWEQMALTRARVIVAPLELKQKIEASIRFALTRPRDPKKLVFEIADMREKIAKEHSPNSIWDIKYLRGGLVDLEFLAQYLQLAYGPGNPEILDTNTTGAFDRLQRVGVLPAAEAAQLIEAMRLWRRLQGLLRVAVAGDFEPESSPQGLKMVLARACGLVDFAELKQKIVQVAGAASALYQRHIAGPAAAIARTEDER